MGTGFDEGGADDLFCGKPPGAALRRSRLTGCGTYMEDTDFFIEEYKPNCIFWPDGHYVDNPGNCTYTYRAVPGGTGTTDLCLEAWIKMRLGPSFSWNAVAPDGAASQPPVLAIRSMLYPGPAVGASMGIAHYGGQIHARVVENLNVVDQAGTLPSGWHHVAVNCQRGGNLTFYIDGILQGTAGGVPAYTFGWGNLTTGLSTDYDRGGWVGPLAFHARLLTTAEIRNSVIGKTVQVVTETEYAYDWRDLVVTPVPGGEDKLIWQWVDNTSTAAATQPNYGRWGSNDNIAVALNELDELYVLQYLCDTVCPAGYVPDKSANSADILIRGSSAAIVFALDSFWK